MRDSALGFFRDPGSVAVVGASADPAKAGGAVLSNLLSGGFRGPVWAVNPRHERLAGRPCFPSLRALPAVPDLVVAAVPAGATIRVVREAEALGVRAVVVLAAGFAETGTGGALLQESLAAVASRPSGPRILGPNCLGVLDPRSGVDTFFIPADRLARPGPGPIAILSQSGSFALALVERLSREGPGVSVALSYGNRADLGESEALESLADDGRTRVVAVVMESVDDGPRFLEAASRCSARKPVVALKCGRGEGAAAAVRSHTGALAGRAAVYGAAFLRAGVVEVSGLDELVDAAKVLAMQPASRGPRLLVVTNGGGFGAACADAAQAAGLELPALPSAVAERLRDRLPAFASVRNPVDLTPAAGDAAFGDALDEAFAAPDAPFDVALVACLTAAPTVSAAAASRVATAARRAGRPVLGLHVGGGRGEAVARAFEEAGIPLFPTPERAVAAAGVLVRRGSALRRIPGRGRRSPAAVEASA